MTSLLVLDTETTGLPEKGSNMMPEIIEMAYTHIVCHSDDFDSLFEPSKCESFNSYYEPSIPVTLGAIATHHILPSQLEGYPSSSLCRISDTASYDYLIGHNIDFDWKCLGKPDIKRICTLALARSVWPSLDSHSLSALCYHVRGLTEETRTYLRGAHSASTDVQTCLILLKALIKELEPASWDTLYSLSERARVPTLMPFGKHYKEPISKLPASYVTWALKNMTDMDPYLRQALMGDSK